MEIKLITTVEQFVQIQKGDSLLVKWNDDFVKHTPKTKNIMFYTVYDNKSLDHEIICQKKDNHFLYLDHANDATIDYLYKHAYFTVFPTQYEGFGLPIIESFLHKTPVLASDIPVLREVGGDLCEYFSLADKTDMLRLLQKYKSDPDAYIVLRSQLEHYVPFSWDQSEEQMWNALQPLLRAGNQ